MSEDGQVFVSSIDLDNAKKAIFIVDTKGSHSDLTDEYAAIRTEMELSLIHI